MNKNLLKQRFEKHLQDYNNYAVVQKKMAKTLAGLLKEKHYNTVLELGCGTGFLTEEIVNNIGFDNYTALDIVPECDEFIKKISRKIVFLSEDFENFTINTDKKFDLIISNALLQWSEDLKASADKLIKILAPNGYFLFSTFGKNNFKEIREITGLTLNYYSAAELKTMFPEAQIIEEKYNLEFKSCKDILVHIKNTGVNAIERKSWTRKDLRHFESEYNRLCGDALTLTYNPIYIKLKNPTVG